MRRQTPMPGEGARRSALALLAIGAALLAVGVSDPTASGVAVVARASGGAKELPQQADPSRAAGSVPRCRLASWPARPDGRVRAVVLLAEQADLSGARAVERRRRPAWVYNRLRAVAERTQPELEAWLRARGASVRRYHIANMFVVDADAATLCAVERRAGVWRVVEPPQGSFDRTGSVLDGPRARVATRWLEPQAHERRNRPKVPTGPFAPAGPAAVEPGLRRIGADAVWAMGIRGQGAVIAILDTGVDGDHAALTRSWRGRDGGPVPGADHNWLDPIDGASAPEDESGHGTHIAGTAVGEDRTRQIGVAPDADWIACRVGTDAGLDFGSVTRCMEWVLAPTRLDGSDPRPDLAPDVIAASWSFDAPGSCTAEWLRLPIRALVAAGVTWVASAGNNGPDCEAVCAPGGYEEALTVANYDPNTSRIHPTSSRGPFAGVDKPDIAAPGANIQSSEPRGRYGRRTGTSMAVPHVAGAVALLIAARPDLRLDPPALRTWLEETAEFVDPDRCGPRDADVRTHAAGHGLLRIDEAVEAALESAPTASPPASVTPSPSATSPATSTPPPPSPSPSPSAPSPPATRSPEPTEPASTATPLYLPRLVR